jgi:hypothetical protein
MCKIQFRKREKWRAKVAYGATRKEGVEKGEEWRMNANINLVAYDSRSFVFSIRKKDGSAVARRQPSHSLPV